MEVKFGTITQESPARVRFDGEDTASDITYKRNASYTPNSGDRVYVLIEGGVYIIQGKII